MIMSPRPDRGSPHTPRVRSLCSVSQCATGHHSDNVASDAGSVEPCASNGHVNELPVAPMSSAPVPSGQWHTHLSHYNAETLQTKTNHDLRAYIPRGRVVTPPNITSRGPKCRVKHDFRRDAAPAGPNSQQQDAYRQLAI